MAFGGKVHDRVNSEIANKPCHRRCIADVGDDEIDVSHPSEARPISRIGETIYDRDMVLWIPTAPIANEVGADESSAASYK